MTAEKANHPNLKKGFQIAKDSEIAPHELLTAGFIMKKGRFFPAQLEAVKTQIRKSPNYFVILDVSTPTECIYSFDRCPF